MKRNENLKTLSWDHHDGLVVSFRLQQGLKKNVSVAEMAEYVLHTWSSVLEHHFWQEEQTITPNLKHSEKGKELVKQMIDDHKRFGQLEKQIQLDKSNIQDVEEFALLLNQHIRFEERQLFPFFEQEVGLVKLQEVGKFLKQHHNPSCEIWPNQFWKS